MEGGPISISTVTQHKPFSCVTLNVLVRHVILNCLVLVAWYLSTVRLTKMSNDLYRKQTVPSNSFTPA